MDESIVAGLIFIILDIIFLFEIIISKPDIFSNFGTGLYSKRSNYQSFNALYIAIGILGNSNASQFIFTIIIILNQKLWNY